MFYLFVTHNRDWLSRQHLDFLRVFGFPSFQGTLAMVLSFALVVAFGPWVINWLRKQKIGDLAHFDQAEVDKLMEGKKGTPTMGGSLIIASISLTSFLLADISNFYVRMALLCLIWLGCVGATDDWLKLTAGRRAGSRDGLTTREKLMFQIGLGVLLSYFTYQHGAGIPQTHSIYVPFFKNVQLDLTVLNALLPALPHLNYALLAFIVIGTLVLVGSSNAVNLTDGLDGLASGCMAIVGVAFFILALICGTVEIANYLFLPYVQTTAQMAVIAGGIVGSCLGFLWYNCSPARVFMGDTGSLALGGLIGYIAIVVRQELMLFLIGGIFVAEAVSVLLQVSYFKYSRLRTGTGQRIFLMAPLHHHFQRKGWTETQVVVRFWLIGAMLAALALATIKLR